MFFDVDDHNGLKKSWGLPGFCILSSSLTQSGIFAPQSETTVGQGSKGALTSN